MQVKMASKLELAAIVAAACGMLSIEHGNHIFTDVSTRTERSPLAAADCPDNDSLPYPASCLIFLEGKLASDVRHRSAAGKAGHLGYYLLLRLASLKPRQEPHEAHKRRASH